MSYNELYNGTDAFAVIRMTCNNNDVPTPEVHLFDNWHDALAFELADIDSWHDFYADGFSTFTATDSRGTVMYRSDYFQNEPKPVMCWRIECVPWGFR